MGFEPMQQAPQACELPGYSIRAMDYFIMYKRMFKIIAKKKILEKDLARQRIKILLKLAIEKYDEEKYFAKNCVRIAFNIKKKFNLRFPKWFKNMYCRKCFNILKPGKSARIRIEGKKNNLKIITTCLDCGKVIRKELGKVKV